MLIPPDNFGMVEAGLYRCLKLEAEHLPFLETLQLKLLVLLDVAKPPRTLKTFLSDNNVELYNLGGMKISNHQITGSPGKEKSDGSGSMSSADSNVLHVENLLLDRLSQRKNDLWMIIEKNLIVAAFEILLDRNKHSVLLVDSTLALVGILRKIQKWNFNSIVNEYRIYTGNSSKSSYNVEVFLELVSLELVPFELELARKREESLEAPRRPSLTMSRNSLLTQLKANQSFVDGDDDAVFSEDYEDEVDDDILSASPQIPANLLKLVEQRKNDGPSPSTSPDYRRGSMSRKNSVDTVLKASHQRRKSSTESRYLFSNNNRFRDPLHVPSAHSPRHGSLENSLRHFRMGKSKSSTEDELQRIKERCDYKYYRAAEESAGKFNVIKLRIPPEHSLAPWFIKGRDFWENRIRKA